MSHPQIEQIRVITFDFRVTTTFIFKKKYREFHLLCLCRDLPHSKTAETRPSLVDDVFRHGRVKRPGSNV